MKNVFFFRCELPQGPCHKKHARRQTASDGQTEVGERTSRDFRAAGDPKAPRKPTRTDSDRRRWRTTMIQNESGIPKGSRHNRDRGRSEHGDPLEGQQEVKTREIVNETKNIQVLPRILGGKKVPSDGQTELGERTSRDFRAAGVPRAAQKPTRTNSDGRRRRTAMIQNESGISRVQGTIVTGSF